MTYIQRVVINSTTGSDSAATTYSSDVLRGYVHSIVYVPGASGSSFPNTTDFTITGEVSGVNVLTVANVAAGGTYLPRAEVVRSTAGGSTAAALDMVAIADERLKLVIADGGIAKSGTFHVYIA